MSVATAPAGPGRLHDVPPGWGFDTRADSPTRCTHTGRVVIRGNVDTFKIWWCLACREEVVPVAPGWRWDRRRRTHVNLAAEAARAASGHAGAYLERA